MLKRKDVAECVIERVDYPNCGRYKTEEGQKLILWVIMPPANRRHVYIQTDDYDDDEDED